jgi:hypothetical protein
MRAGKMVPETYCFCPRCASRVDIGRVPRGAALTCPLCSLEFDLSGGPNPNAEAAERLAQDDGHGDTDVSRAKQQAAWEAAGRMPSLGLFFSGTFRFPFYRQTLPESLTLLIGAVVVLTAAWLAIWSQSSDSAAVDKFLRVGYWHGLLLAIVVGTPAAAGWLVVASAYAVTVVRETSYGADAIESWPNFFLLEGLGDSLYVVNGLILTSLPGVLAVPLWRWLDVSRSLGIAITIPVLFPIVLLSMLDRNSPVSPLGPTVWRSVLHGWRVWLGFYVTTLAAAAMAVGLAAAAARYGGLVGGMAVAGAMIGAGWIVYFRLLGRLAAFCAGHWDKDGTAGTGLL